ncbi:HNH endonuclease-domain-containing protein [Aspergillus cavernicola]|uniref:HNH endonuclease-domain-containing protein n=1 Tax=Aspergillus cavernicola TaxID=176166 RepID=A0ABR4HME5_9EURO
MPEPFASPACFRPRNVHIFAGNGDHLGGTWLNSPAYVTNEEFHEMCEHFVQFPAARYRWRLHRLGADNTFGARVHRDSGEIQVGRYVVLGNQSQVIPVSLTGEQSVRRVHSGNPPTSSLRHNQRHFRDGVLRRDGKCVLTGRKGKITAPMRSLRAAHIFPVARFSLWTQENYDAWITDTTDNHLISPKKLFSVQNGLLLAADVHDSFDAFEVAINPDKGYKTVSFVDDPNGEGGRVLDRSTRDCSPNDRVNDQCLRWHYHQAVLANMRGAGEKVWEFDHDVDEMGDLIEEDRSGELLELEFADRLGPYVDVEESN